VSLLQWAVLCTAAGIDVRPMDPMDCYTVAGKIIHDETLRQATFKLGGSRADVLRGWSESERAALRERISGVVVIHSKQ
jgi:hypothetical protein